MNTEDKPPVVPPAPPPASPSAGASFSTPSSSGMLLLAALGYPIWICALITVLVEKQDQEVRYHGWNALFWGLAYLVIMIGLGIVIFVVHSVPGLPRLLMLIMNVLPLLYLVLSIVFAINAYNHKPVNIPVISDWARQQVRS